MGVRGGGAPAKKTQKTLQPNVLQEECKAREQTAQDQALNFSRQLEKKQQECALLQADVFRLNRLKDQVANSTITQQQLREAERQLQEAMQRESELDAKLSRASDAGGCLNA